MKNPTPPPRPEEHPLFLPVPEESLVAPRPEERLGRVARELREARGWSQDELAQKMTDAGFAWSQSTVTRTESATRPIRVDEAVALAQVFVVGVEKLVGRGSPTSDLIQGLQRRRETLLRALDDVSRKRDEITAEITKIDAKMQAIMQLVDARSAQITGRITGSDDGGFDAAIKHFVGVFEDAAHELLFEIMEPESIPRSLQ